MPLGIIMFVVLGAGALAWVIANQLKFSALQRIGRRTTGVVVSTDGDADLENAWSMTVAYQDDQGGTHRTTSRGGTTSWRNAVGRKVTVYYDPATPSRVRILEDARYQGIVGIIITLVCFAGAVLIAVMG